MPADVITNWLKSRKTANINGIELSPLAHPKVPGNPLSVQRGQAETFFLKTPRGDSFVLKKLYDGKFTGIDHLRSVSRLLPQKPGFESGIERQILSDKSLNRRGSYRNKDLAIWLKNTILMPKIQGSDWTAMIEKLRNEAFSISAQNRLTLCKNLASLVVFMENHKVAHRDLSSGNIFVQQKGISLIDFDAMYHPSLSIPNSTTIGSEGYIAPFAKNVESTWNSYADRFALTILCVEMLILDKNSPCNGEGGIFSQDDLDNRSGLTIDYTKSTLKINPQVLELFINQSLISDSFDKCPPPKSWLNLNGVSNAVHQYSPPPITKSSTHMPEIFGGKSLEEILESMFSQAFTQRDTTNTR